MGATGLVELPPGVKAEHAPFMPVGNNLVALNAREREVLLEGPAGTGKSRLVAEKVFALCDQVPGFKSLHVRQTRDSITNSTKPIIDEEVIPVGHPAYYHTGKQRYEFPHTRSYMVLAGLDKPTKAMSSQYHLIWIGEGTEVTLDAYEMLLSRIGRAPGGAGWAQIITDVNPSYPTHWLNQRFDEGARRTRLRVRTRHEDNPTVTEAYLEILRSLTGVRRQRLYEGKWVAAEGQIYDAWRDDIHLVNRFDVPEDWPAIFSVDFGFVDPFVWQCWRLRPADRALFLQFEIYRTKRRLDEHAETIRRVCREHGIGRPAVFVRDWDAQGGATLDHLLGTASTPASKNLHVGIQLVQKRLEPGTTGRGARLYLMRDAQVDVDHDLKRDKRAWRTQDEVAAYEWDTTGGRKKGEQPVDRDNHGMDPMRYAVAAVDGVGSALPMGTGVVPVALPQTSRWTPPATGYGGLGGLVGAGGGGLSWPS